MTTNAGDVCPGCGKGQLWPNGYREIAERRYSKGSKMGEATEFKCDTCGQTVTEVDVHRAG